MAPDQPSRAFTHDDESHAINALFLAIGLAGLQKMGSRACSLIAEKWRVNGIQNPIW